MTVNVNIDALLSCMAKELSALMERRDITDPLMVGIQTGGVWLAERLHTLLEVSEELGRLDISFVLLATRVESACGGRAGVRGGVP